MKSILPFFFVIFSFICYGQRRGIQKGLAFSGGLIQHSEIGSLANFRFGLIKIKPRCVGYNAERGLVFESDIWLVLTAIELSASSNFNDYSQLSLLYRQDLTFLSLANLMSLRNSRSKMQKMTHRLLSIYPTIAMGYGFIETSHLGLGSGFVFEAGVESGKNYAFQLVRFNMYYRGGVYKNALSSSYGVGVRVSLGKKPEENGWMKHM